MKIEESIHVVFGEFLSSDNKSMEEEDQEDWMNIHTQTSPKGGFKEQQRSPPNNNSIHQDTFQQFALQKQCKFIGDHP